MLRLRTRCAPATVLAVGLLLVVACRAPDSRPTRLVLITLDTLRYDAVFGSASVMPHLAAWAQQSTVFDRCFSASSSTQPTHASLFTGLHPWQHGLTANGFRLGDELTTVAETLQANGFSTAAVVASGPVSRQFGFDQGFESFEDRFRRAPNGKLRRVRRRSDPEGEIWWDSADWVSRQALELFETAPEGDHFWWLHYFDPHEPYGKASSNGSIAKSEIFSRVDRGEDAALVLAEVRQAYRQDATFLDRELGRVLDRLSDESSRYRTHVVIAADHGEGLGENGLLGHGNQVIPAIVRVPCLIRSPQLEPGVRTEVVGSVDLWRTLHALANTSVAKAAGSGADLRKDAPRGAFGLRQTHNFKDRRLDGAVVEGRADEPRFYLVDSSGTLYRGNERELLDPLTVGTDTKTSRDEDVRAAFGAFETQLIEATSEPVNDPEALRALRALGYLN